MKDDREREESNMPLSRKGRVAACLGRKSKLLCADSNGMHVHCLSA